MPNTLVARPLQALVSVGLVGAVVMMLATVGVAGPAAAGSPQTATCSFNGVQSSRLVSGISPGSTITILCSGLPANTLVVVAQGSELSALLPSTDELDEFDTSAMLAETTSSTGTVNATFTVPETFEADDPKAQCPPTQTQQNAGMIGCTVFVGDLSGPHYGDVLIQYSSEAGPQSPTLTLSATNVEPGQTISMSGGPGTGSDGQWWGNFASNQVISDSEITLGGVAVPSESSSVAAATYPITRSKGKNKYGPLTAPVLSGSFTVPCGTGTEAVSVSEPNATPLAGTISATASVTVSSEETPAVTGLSPDHGRKKGGTSVTVSGCKFSGVTAVYFGTILAKSFHVDNSHSITAVSPAGTGVVNVIVHTASGVSSAYVASQFTYGAS